MASTIESPATQTLAEAGVGWTWRGRRARVLLPGLSDGASPVPRPCLVHLVRAANGPGPLRAFAAALRAHPPGIDCELVLAMKGFRSSEEARAHLDEVADLEPETLFFSDAGQDLSVYLATAARVRRRRYCFLNSFSVPLVDGWLAKLDAALDQPGAGLVGATASWASTRSWVAYSLRLPNAYRGALPPPHMVRQQLLAVAPEHAERVQRSARESLRERATALRVLLDEEGFPAPRVRTNAFMVSHVTLQRLRLHSIHSKLDALALEGGRDSITRQVQRLGLRTLVVDRSGGVYDHERWDRSRTFYQGDQEGLLVADNRTLLYERGDAALRRVLSCITWGSHARPRSSRESGT